MQLVTVIDCTGDNLGAIDPPASALLAGYVTGAGNVPWTPAQFSRYPTAVRIDQSPADTPADETADVYDLEANAGTLDNLPAWVHGAWASWRAGRRPGQRKPCVYCSRSTVTPAVNRLTAAGITTGVFLWIAQPASITQAVDEITNAGGPFPVVGRQFQFQALFDMSVVSPEWLNDVSKTPSPPVKHPGIQSGWAHCGKCQVLFYGPGQEYSVCPAGGQHSTTASHDYSMGYDW